jgi:nucleoside-triphosphatase
LHWSARFDSKVLIPVGSIGYIVPMKPQGKTILVTGFPGVGKTTLIREISRQFQHLHPAGFYTSEIRDKGRRKGFRLIDLNGRKIILAHVEISSRSRVGTYGVDIEAFETYLHDSGLLQTLSPLIIIDEIGKMECLSPQFVSLVRSILASDRDLIATVAMKGSGFIDEIKQRYDSRLFELTIKNRDSLASEIIGYYSS